MMGMSIQTIKLMMLIKYDAWQVNSRPQNSLRSDSAWHHAAAKIVQPAWRRLDKKAPFREFEDVYFASTNDDWSTSDAMCWYVYWEYYTRDVCSMLSHRGWKVFRLLDSLGLRFVVCLSPCCFRIRRSLIWYRYNPTVCLGFSISSTVRFRTEREASLALNDRWWRDARSEK